jgi:hypothetical protein
VGAAGDELIVFLENAALDGHTVTPIAVAGAILTSRSLRLEDALRDVGPEGRGLVAAVSDLLGLRRLVDAERSVAAEVVARARSGSLQVVTGPASAERSELAVVAGGSRPAVLDDAERLDVETFAAFFASCADDETVVLAGDLDEIGPAGAGQVFADIASSGMVQVQSVAAASGSVISDVVASVRAGDWAVPDDPTRQVVRLDVASMAEAVHRAGQLITTSIPRALGIASPEVQVLTVLDGDLAALNEGALTVSDAVGQQYPAVVFVVSPASSGVLSRPLVYSALRRAQRHVSIVNAAGSALADAVRGSGRPRRTLLAGQLSSGSHSRSSSDSSSSSSDSSRPSSGPNGVTSSNPENSASS